MTRPCFLLLAMAAIGFLAPEVLAAADPAHPWVPGELIVRFNSGVAAADKATLVGGHQLGVLRFVGAEHWKLPAAASVEAAVAALEADPRVDYAEPNYLLHALETPNDPLFGEQWNLHNIGQILGGVPGVPDADIDAPEAWDLSIDSASVVVAVIDTGIDFLHPDLAANMWTNPGEIAGNGQDDDGNGFSDDIHGWDFTNGDAEPMDDNSHGTHCAGIIGAIGDNGAGVAGVSRNVRLMAVKSHDASGNGSITDAVLSIEYATLMGAEVLSCSWSSGAFSEALAAAVAAAYAADIFLVAAAGNTGTDNDALPVYPSGYDLGNVISVMATDSRDRPAAEYSYVTNYGANTVDLAAPGVRIWSTVRNGNYMYLSGTSMATPHVAGALALLRARVPGISVDDGRNVLLTVGNDRLASLTGLCVTGGRLNLHSLIAHPDSVPPPTVADLAVVAPGSNWLELTWTTPVDDGVLLSYDLRHAPYPIIDQAGWDAATSVGGEPAPAAPGAPEAMRVEGLSVTTTYYFCLRTRDVYGNLSDLSNSPGGTTSPPPTVAVTPDSLTAALFVGDIVTRSLTIANTGVGVLDFAIPHHIPASDAGQGEAGQGEARTTGSGGPDKFGYDWIDSDTPGGPAFNWIDISGSGIPVSLTGDSNQGPFDLGFPFPYYGTAFTTFQIGTHGCVSLSDGWTPATNTPLPSPDAPGNLLALLWDQMYPGSGLCLYHSDGTRLVVQYTNLDDYGTGGPYSMQMQLYPDGFIEYHYLTVTSPAGGSATIGLQNALGTDGLTVAHNTAYLHDHLAIRFAPPPSWLAIDPASGSLGAGASVAVDVTFDTTQLCGKRFDANLHVTSNDPLAPDVIVPVGLDLSGWPDLAARADSLDFGAAYIGQTLTRASTLFNRGCGDLHISALSFDNPSFASPQVLPLTIAIGDSASVLVSFSPLTTGAIAGTLTVLSDDPDAPAFGIPLSGWGMLAPDIMVDPQAVAETLPTSGQSTRPLTITNRGQNVLNFAIPSIEYLADNVPTPGPWLDSPIPDLSKAIADTSTSAVGALGAGGPDAFGYRWTDSDDARGPTYNWVEILTNGTGIPFSFTENLGPYPIGFSFPFYGATYTTFRVCANGWISFTSTSNTALNFSLPSTSAPANLIAPYWDDLTVTGGAVLYRADGRRLIVEYKTVARNVVGGFCSFQLHLYPTGRIEFHYQAVPETQDSATIGIQNATYDCGLTVAHNTRFIHTNHAIRFEANPPWLSATPSSGNLEPGASTVVTLGFNAASRCGSTAAANLHVLSNDPDSPDLVVPVSLTSLTGPDARISPTSLALGSGYLTQGTTVAASLANLGCAELQITDLTIDNAVFTADVAVPFSVAAGTARTINVAFMPVVAGPVAGTMTLTTNDALVPSLRVPLSGTGLLPPNLVVTPTSIAAIVQPGHQRTETIHLENSGAGTLNFSIAAPELFTKDLDRPGAPPAVVAGKAAYADGDGITAAPLGSGGPDAVGYRWVDSDAAGGPVFSWIEIAGTGTAIMTYGTDWTAGPFALPFSVSFYGMQSSSFWVNTDGYLCLTDPVYNGGANRSLPYIYGPRAMLAAFWDDLDLSAAGSGDVWYKIVDGNLVVEWDRVRRRGTSTPVTFEIILTPAGVCYFQYLSVSSAATTSATVGIQNWNGTVGLPVVYNAPYLHDNLAILLWLPRWAIVSALGGTIAPGGSTDLTVTFNTAGVPLGLHHGQVRILSNDIVAPTVPVELSLEVKNYISATDDALPRLLNLAQNVPNPFNPSTVIRVALPARGPVDLRIYDLRGALIRTLVDAELAAGYHDYVWEGRTDSGGQAPSGVYFYRLQAYGSDLTRRMTLLK